MHKGAVRAFFFSTCHSTIYSYRLFGMKTEIQSGGDRGGQTRFSALKGLARLFVMAVFLERKGIVDDTQQWHVHMGLFFFSPSLSPSMFTNNFCSHEWASGFLTNDTFHPSSVG